MLGEMSSLVGFVYLGGCVGGLWLGPRLMMAGMRPAVSAVLPPAQVVHGSSGLARVTVPLGGELRHALRLLGKGALVAAGFLLTTTPWHLGLWLTMQ